MRWTPPRWTAPGLLRRMAIALTLGLSAAAAQACETTTPTNVSIGPFSPAAIKATAVPVGNTSARGGFSCASTGILALLSGNYLKATLAAGSNLQLTSGGNTITYKLYADAAATAELKAGIATSYVSGTSINLLNLSGNGAVNVPVYFKLTSASFVPAGTYTGSFSVRWDWYFCQGIGLFDACILGTPDQGSNKNVTVNVTLTVEPKPPTVSISMGPTTWNSVEGTSNPKAIPGAKRRLSVTITNPDTVAVESNTLLVVLPTPSKMAVALDGDGTAAAVVQTTDGSPASGLTLSYTSPSSSSDNVDFSTDGGSSWTASPVAGNATSQNAVTHVRFRPQGSMAASSSATVSIPYSVK